MIIDFVNNCLRLKDNIICNQANEYKVGEGNPQKNKKSVSMKALKQEEPTSLIEIANDYLKSQIPEGMTRKTVQTVEPNNQWV